MTLLATKRNKKSGNNKMILFIFLHRGVLEKNHCSIQWGFAKDSKPSVKLATESANSLQQCLCLWGNFEQGRQEGKIGITSGLLLWLEMLLLVDLPCLVEQCRMKHSYRSVPQPFCITRDASKGSFQQQLHRLKTEVMLVSMVLLTTWKGSTFPVPLKVTFKVPCTCLTLPWKKMTSLIYDCFVQHCLCHVWHPARHVETPRKYLRGRRTNTRFIQRLQLARHQQGTIFRPALIGFMAIQ